MPLIHTPAQPPRRHAGGGATEAGMAFQAAVGTWFAVHILARLPVGGRFGLNNTAIPTSLCLETGEALDDIEIGLSDSGRIYVQAKTNASLSAGPDTAFGKTIRQLAQFVAHRQNASPPLDPTANAAVLAVGSIPGTLAALQAACRAFDVGGDWAAIRLSRNAAQRSTLDIFAGQADAAWTAYCGRAVEDSDRVDMARLFHIAAFTMDEGGSDWREASRILGFHLFGDAAAGDAPLRDLRGIVRDLIGNGAPADRSGLLRALQRRGHIDIATPDFAADIARLRDTTVRELARLAVHGRLPLDGGVPITRSSHLPLITAIRAGSLLVIGEPGAGKTGALVHAAEALVAQGDTVLFLSIDRFPGVATATDLAAELRLIHPLNDVLRAFPGAARKILIIDALDAARGEPAEAVFASLIEDVDVLLSEDWIVAASIRTFDLKNGQRFRASFAGPSADTNYAEPGLGNIRHFLIPRLTTADLEGVGIAAPALGALLATAPNPLVALLRNIFNLSLAAQLLADGTDPATFNMIRTQSGLIDAYEDRRLITTERQVAAATTVAAMASRRRLTVRKVIVGHPALDAVIASGVLVEAGDLVSFAHHILFDHVAGRFHLDWEDPSALIAQLTGDSSTAFMLAPALRFAVERLWRLDRTGRAASWTLAESVHSTAVDPILLNVAMQVIVENIADKDDVADLLALMAARPSAPATIALVGRIARFTSMNSGGAAVLSQRRALALARIADTAIASGELALVDAGRILLHLMFDKADLADVDLAAAFGAAARALLQFAWDHDPPLDSTATAAIRFVGLSYASDSGASRRLLDRILRNPHFVANADREGPSLAEQIRPITHADPDFTVEIYAALYGQEVSDDAISYMGGRPSRILPLSSNRRQDFQHSRWILGTAFADVLDIAPDHGTRALIEARIGHSNAKGYKRDDTPTIDLGDRIIELRGYDIEANAWEEEYHRQRDGNLLTKYVHFLRTCSSTTFATSVAAASRNYATGSVWARIFGVGAERVEAVGDVLWPLVDRPDFFEELETQRDAIRFVAAAWASRSADERSKFETMALNSSRFADDRQRRRWGDSLQRLLNLIPEDALVLQPMQALRRDLEAQGGLRENDPHFRITSGWREAEDFAREDLRRAGVDPDAPRTKTLLDDADTLAALVKNTPELSPSECLTALWAGAEALAELFDSQPNYVHEQVTRSVWGYIAHAVGRIASSPAFTPGEHNLPSLDRLFTMLDRLSASPFPELHENSGQSISWGDRAVRVYAAEAWVALAPRFAVDHPRIANKLEEILEDPVPAVRLQVAHSLQVICKAAPDRMWALATKLAAGEADERVLAFYLDHSMRRFSHSDPERCEDILAIVRNRIIHSTTSQQEGRDSLQESLGNWTAQLLAGQGRTRPQAWFAEWAQDPTGFVTLLNSFCIALRQSFFGRYADDASPGDMAINDRAQVALEKILVHAVRISNEARAAFHNSELTEENKAAAVDRYTCAERVIHNAMNQIYFGSGAFAGESEVRGLAHRDAMCRFLADYPAILTLLSQSREPQTLHHLIELYQFLVLGDPISVFEALYGIMLGPGAEEGYQYETLGSSVAIQIFHRYIADHRDIFEDDGRRQRLAAILQLFSDAGWPEASRLLFDLPDLLR